ncbi:MAG: hypothetical protein Kow0088_00670 [Anaerolineales bacterium]
MKTYRKKIPCLLIPFWLVWKLIAFIVELTGRILAVVLGFALIIAGILISLTIVGLIIGLPMILIGVLLVLRGIF